MFNIVRAAAAAITLVVVWEDAQAQSRDSLQSLLAAYRCPVVDRLDRIYEGGDRASDRDRFLAVTVPEHAHGYVQCIFQQRRAKLLCEASSGYYYGKPNTPRTFRLESVAVAALAKLGFSTDDTGGNFQIWLDTPAPLDFNPVADFILKALHDGYGARADSRLHFNAPFARRATSKCIPLG